MAISNKEKIAQKHKTTKRNPRYYELLHLASEGNEEAVHDLWLEYHFDFHRPAYARSAGLRRGDSVAESEVRDE